MSNTIVYTKRVVSMDFKDVEKIMRDALALQNINTTGRLDIKIQGHVVFIEWWDDNKQIATDITPTP